MTKPFSSDLFDKLVSLGLELVDTGRAEITGDMRTDVVRNVEHLVRHQMEYISIWWSEERGFYANEKTPLGIFTYFMNDEKRNYNEKAFNRAVNEHLAFLEAVRKNTINIISENVRRMSCSAVIPELVILPEGFKPFKIDRSSDSELPLLFFVLSTTPHQQFKTLLDGNLRKIPPTRIRPSSPL